MYSPVKLSSFIDIQSHIASLVNIKWQKENKNKSEKQTTTTTMKKTIAYRMWQCDNDNAKS